VQAESPKFKPQSHLKKKLGILKMSRCEPIEYFFIVITPSICMVKEAGDYKRLVLWTSENRYALSFNS
jgi:hypothetical protein